MLTAICAIGATSCKTETKQNESKNYKLQTARADTDKEITTAYSASIEGMQDIDIYPQVAGYIEKLNVSEGILSEKEKSCLSLTRFPTRQRCKRPSPM